MSAIANTQGRRDKYVKTKKVKGVISYHEAKAKLVRQTVKCPNCGQRTRIPRYFSKSKTLFCDNCTHVLEHPNFKLEKRE